MPNPTQGQAANAPVWNPTTIAQAVILTGAADLVAITGYYIVLSNTGANNVWISPDPAVQGVLVSPGETFETAIMPNSSFYVVGTAAQPVSIVEYKNV